MIDLLFAALILAHSWYPQECCNGTDCRELPYTSVKVTPDGYQIVDVTGHIYTTIPYDKARQSQDEHFHVCGAVERPYCFFAPRGTT